LNKHPNQDLTVTIQFTVFHNSANGGQAKEIVCRSTETGFRSHRATRDGRLSIMSTSNAMIPAIQPDYSNQCRQGRQTSVQRLLPSPETFLAFPHGIGN
jgi:hypothetical protein